MYFITGNQNKFKEVQAMLPGIEQLAVELPEIQEIDAHAIIRAKLTAAFEHAQGEFIVEDTSLHLDCLNGLPGPLIKWFLKAIGRQGLADIALKAGNTKAEARTIIGYAKNPNEISFFEGAVSGTIVAPRGETTFGWDPIFQPEGYDTTFAEMSADQKNAISMRRQAVEKLTSILSSK